MRTQAEVQHFKTQLLFIITAKCKKFKAPLDYLLSCTIFLATPTTSSQPFREKFANLPETENEGNTLAGCFVTRCIIIGKFFGT